MAKKISNKVWLAPDGKGEFEFKTAPKDLRDIFVKKCQNCGSRDDIEYYQNSCYGCKKCKYIASCSEIIRTENEIIRAANAIVKERIKMLKKINNSKWPSYGNKNKEK